jgi:RNA polymerase sigma-70 factor, ECF subfamily
MSDFEKQRFHKLYADHQRMVRSVLYQMIGRNSLDDMVQETFIKIWKSYPRFHFLSSEKTWIYRIVVNTAIDYLRKAEHKNTRLSMEFIDQIPTPIESFGDDQQQKVQKALQQLDEAHRVVVVLHYFEELELSEISQILKIPLGTIKSRLFNARQRLKNLLVFEGGLIEFA